MDLDLAESAVKKFKTSLQHCWTNYLDSPGWTHYIPTIVAAYATTCAESIANTPAAVFFEAEAVCAEGAYDLHQVNMQQQTSEQLEEMIREQVESQ
ncbi:hypothetical protein H4S08_004111, partial [Coemansia sp. RSA 1365]